MLTGCTTPLVETFRPSTVVITAGRPVRIEDEEGRAWLVEKGDPAQPLIKLLVDRGYEYAVLPARLLCGIIDSSMPTSEPADLVRRTRLQDCLGVLKREGVLSS